jgi:hypothetical protein
MELKDISENKYLEDWNIRKADLLKLNFAKSRNE